ncbi:hypothetical protein HHL08_22095 [Sphingobium sp. AR-3-1]|uniref:Uncharacterized protein n=1 Tax=Sphingobium psychrophilum TaxID=2728834 RepID=A0A7X9WZI9_9SPHN|nr:hypothetical protein [Sphingobium psychrophilum]NML12792.1 hypothetical protein [Sphingobium psychrophilum]
MATKAIWSADWIAKETIKPSDQQPGSYHDLLCTAYDTSDKEREMINDERIKIDIDK